MLIFIILFFLIFMILAVLSRKEVLSGKASALETIFLKMAVWISKREWFSYLVSYKVKDNLELLHPAKPIKEICKEYYIDKLKLILMLLFVGNLLTFFAFVTATMEEEIKEGDYIIRNESGEGEKQIEAAAYIQTPQETKRTDITIVVSEEGYAQEEMTEVFWQIEKGLETAILGENECLSHVTNSLDLITKYETYPVTISWTSSDYTLLDEDGSIYNEELIKEQTVMLTANLSYKEWKKEVAYEVCIFPKVYTVSEKRKKQLNEALTLSDKQTVSENKMNLPKQIGDFTVQYVEKSDGTPAMMWMMFLICTVLIFFAKDSRLEEQVKKRNEQLLLEYSEFVSKLTLLVNAGMTIKGAILRILTMYEEQKKQTGRINYCYEELKITVYEMESGVYEEKAYENFGRRCKLPIYMKLSGLLVSNVKKGAAHFTKVLAKEASEAFEERKSLAKRQGEEAGTKLLIPMIMMLFIVMVLIMIPAFLSYGF